MRRPSLRPERADRWGGRRSLLVLLLVGNAAATPSQARLEVAVLPSGPFVADGERSYSLTIYLHDGGTLARAIVPTVRAERGAIVEPPAATADGGVRLRWRPTTVGAGADALIVSWPGGKRRVPLPLEAPGGAHLTIDVSPSPLVLAARGGGEQGQVRVHVRDAAGRPLSTPLRLGASVGTVDAPVEESPGEYVARFHAPTARFPQVAILAAVTPVGGGSAATVLPLHARVTVEGQGEPGARVRVLVEGRSFGPLPVDGSGRFAVPVVVPPGGHAVGVSVDALANERRRPIDLGLPPFPRTLLLAVPPSLRADGRARAEIVVAAIDGRGHPLRAAPPALSTDGGKLGPAQAHDDGLFTVPLTAPLGGGGGALHVTAPGARLTVPLAAGPPAKITLTPPPPLASGLDEPQPIDLTVTDRAGAPIEGATVAATLAGGRLSGSHDLGGGRYRIEVIPPPDPGRGHARLRVEVSGAPPGPPRRLSLHALPSPPGQLLVEAWVDDDLGRPVPGVAMALRADGAATASRATVSDRFGAARLDAPIGAGSGGRSIRVTARAPALGPPAASRDLLVLDDGLRSDGGDENEPAPEPPAAEIDVALRQALPIDLHLAVEPRVIAAGGSARLMVRAAGGSRLPPKLLFAASVGRLDEVAAGELRYTAPAAAPPAGRALLAVTDPASGATFVVEVEIR